MCDHLRTETIKILSQERGLVYNTTIVKVKCLDCATNGKPTTFIKQINTGNLSKHVYSSDKVNPSTCKHSKYAVDEATVTERSEPSLGGTLMGMMTAGWLHSNNKYLVGTAKCTRCEKEFQVKCSFHYEKTWENYQEKTTRVKDQWLPLM
jgi:hypothetical protein